MATYYLPSENGWGEDHGYPYAIRLKIEQSYNVSTNKSTLTVTPQFKGGANGVTHYMAATIKAGVTTLIETAWGSPYGFYVTGGSWVSLRNLSSSTDLTATHTVTHSADGSASVSFSLRGQTSSSEATCSFQDTAAAVLSLQETRQYTLTINAGTGSTITVKKGSTTLANGATVTHGDVLTISFGAATGYALATHTVNGSSFTSGNTYTVAGAVTVAATATKKTYTLTTDSGTGSTITVKKGSTTLANGATITHGDVLTINFEAKTGYTLATHTVNGSSFTSGNTHTVSGNVTVAATADRQRSTIASCSSQSETQGSIELILNRAGYNWHKATVKAGSSTLVTTAAFKAQKTISVPRSWFSSYPNVTSFTATVSVQSYTTSDCTTPIGDPVTATVTVKADDGMKPVLNAGYASAAPYNTGEAAGMSGYISGYSRATVTVDSSKLDMSAAAGASVSSVSVKGGGSTDSSAPYRTGILRDTSKITVTVTDSRGRKATQTLEIVCMPYAPPTLSAISVYRCDANGNEDDTGSCFAAQATATISSLNGQNTLTLKAKGYTLQSGVRRIVSAGLQADKTYIVNIIAEDALGNSATAAITLPGQKWAMRFREDGNGVGFGKTPEHDAALELPEDWTVYIGRHQVWGVTVTVPAGGSLIVPLRTWKQYFVAPTLGPTWIVQTKGETAAPTVAVLATVESNSDISCSAESNCAIRVSNTRSSAYNFSIMQI